ncbi:MAG: hypothetical protein E6J45_08130 [Chloroflexi bacterium]|nr:MAG: hypothetical protein E6J45_08130 [Chloroflexota bacterium]
MKSFRFVSLASVLGVAAASLALFGSSVRADHQSAKPDCTEGRLLCTEVANPTEAFGSYYVGHDEPSVEFYSNVAGAGNHVQYQLTIPTEPTGAFSQSNGYDFALRPTFWFGMAMCDTQSYPEQSSKCTPDSDSNIVNPADGFAGAPGIAFEELQFYPPGWVKQFAGFDCDPTRWCVALTIDSLSENPINGTLLNPTCQSEILGGLEYVNFAFLTLDGNPLGPPNPLQFDVATSGNPTNPDTFFLNQGDQATVTLNDTAHGLQTTVTDNTTGQTGTMTASAANGFGQIKFQHGGHSCQMLPYDFHPAYSTSSPQTRVPWAAHSYNVAMSDEIGHFDFCTSIDPNSPEASCNGLEGVPGDQEAADGDDNFCFSAEQSTLYPATGCIDTNAPGFDGSSYQDVWPDAGSLTSPTTRPTPVRFSAPLTGSAYDTAFSQIAFEADLPRIEAADLGGACQRFLALPNAGSGCVNPPVTDEGVPATFYPYYTQLADCDFVEGGNFGTGNSFGGSSTAEFGPLYPLTYWTFRGHGATNQRYNDFNSGPLDNSC